MSQSYRSYPGKVILIIPAQDFILKKKKLTPVEVSVTGYVLQWCKSQHWNLGSSIFRTYTLTHNEICDAERNKSHQEHFYTISSPIYARCEGKN